MTPTGDISGEQERRSSAGSEHTPGPWRASARMETFGVVWADRVSVADVASNSLPTEEQRANARLIAAAPDMLAHVAADISDLEYLINNPSAWPDGFNQEISDLLERVVNRARAVAAKARGASHA